MGQMTDARCADLRYTQQGRLLLAPSPPPDLTKVLDSKERLTMNPWQVTWFCLASFFLGMAVTLKVIFAIAQRQQPADYAEDWLCNLVAGIPLTFAAALFVAGVME